MNIGGITTNPGELRTPITLQRRAVSTGTGGFPVPTWGEGETIATVWAKWVNAHGPEVAASAATESINPATVTIRYRADIDQTCIVLLDGKVYEITNIDDIRQRHEYMELTCVYVRSG